MSNFFDFTGPARPLSQAGLAAVQDSLAIDEVTLFTVLTVETSGCGFERDGRPKILYERHLFSRLTKQAYDERYPDLSDPTPGGYGASGDYQYQRLRRAIQLDREAALQATSWGIGQVLGMHWQKLGYASLDKMIAAMFCDEDSQLDAMARFIKVNQLANKLSKRDWAGFAAAYNGPNYAINSYDSKLAHCYQQLSNGTLPDLRIRSTQLALTLLATHQPEFDPAGIDGWLGKRTRSALLSYQKARGLAQTGLPDEECYPMLCREVGW
ncbi:N-acetylmuramidase domain-containing protein [Chitinimonas lacunae]|uniref:N-acetylmuramidase domain-containing protein n=1 Tax=Chitinimonas lacunae TaxID=1963018 RepID=A0ABV8MT92_9NEIS